MVQDFEDDDDIGTDERLEGTAVIVDVGVEELVLVQYLFELAHTGGGSLASHLDSSGTIDGTGATPIKER